MALVGLVRVSTDKQETARQHDALVPICVEVFEEKISGKLKAADRPGLTAALNSLTLARKVDPDGDHMLCVLDVSRLGRNLLEGLLVLSDLFEAGTAVKVMEGIAAGDHRERSFVLDLALAIAEERRREISKATKSGLEAARQRGRKGGRVTVMTEAMTIQAAALKAKGYTLRQIRPHMRYKIGSGEWREASLGAISQALRAYDEAQRASA
ncbi:MAG: recombinase family protein [Streptomyces sp.]|jgi:DNA invertase Pin-like site-specific DNA recombinase|nr:recombinase family protein [Streptomyces sp.]